MPEKRIKLIFPEGYSVQGFDIIGLWGRPMKENRKGHVRLQRTGEKPYDVSRLKLVWAARMNIDVRKIPKKYSFYLDDNGNLQVDKFSDRMSHIVSERAKEVKVKREDYAFVEKYAHIALQMLDGDNDAKGQLFALINGKREMFIQYARRSGGGHFRGKSHSLHRHGNLLHLRPDMLWQILCPFSYRKRERQDKSAYQSQQEEAHFIQK